MIKTEQLNIIKDTQDFFIAACPQCRQKTLLGDKKTGDKLCYQCGTYGHETHYLNDPPVVSHLNNLNTSQTNWLKNIRIKTDKLSFLYSGIDYFRDEKNWKTCIKIPSYLNKEKKIKRVNVVSFDNKLDFQGIAKNSYPIGYENISIEQIVLVNHPLDYIACIQSNVAGVICPPTPLENPLTQENINFLSIMEDHFKKAEKIVLAFENTKNSNDTEEELGRRIGKERCYRVNWDKPEKTHKEDFFNIGRASTSLLEKNEKYIKTTIKNSKAFPINGIYQLDDVEENYEILYEFGLKKGSSTSWDSLDELYTVEVGQWTIVTGIPGHGKSNVLDALIVNLANQYGWVFGIFSPENQPIERHFVSLTEKHIGKPFLDNVPGHERMSEEEKNKSKKFIKKHFKSILPEDDMNWSIEGILDLAKQTVYRYGIRGLVIDPWNELDHSRPSYMTETEYISKCLTKIRRFAKVYSVHVWVVAHPTKLRKDRDGNYPVPTLYDISGGAHWRNKADNGLVVWRNIAGVDKEVVDIHVQKIRFKEIGRVGRASLRSDSFGGKYIDDIDQQLREKSLQQEEPWPTSSLITQTRQNAYEKSQDKKDPFKEEEVEVKEKQKEEDFFRLAEEEESDNIPF